MFWCDKLLSNVSGPQIINDSKTPSGRVHVGSLRGVLIHDIACKILRERGVPVTYRFGVDDYDPVDSIPYGMEDHFQPYRGFPMCNVPAPPGSKATDMAMHYIEEFFDIFKELGVQVERYHMRDVYRSGQFNEAIDAILQQAAVVREVYQKVSNSLRPDTWYPFQAICEQCGRVGTTEVHDYDGKEVTYTCRPDMVTWAKGCGYQGKVSPFDGRGKLPWKLEWVAKWQTFPVTIEGAGKDHSTKGGSRDVSSACLRRIFGSKPPLNIPYEFFLIGGAKMSTSGGRGPWARVMADFLPPEVLRFLMLKSPANRPVNFSTSERDIIKLYNEVDRCHGQVLAATATEDTKRIWQLCTLDQADTPYYDANFQLVSTIVQMPHLDLETEISQQKGAPLTELDRHHLHKRANAARYWIDNLADEKDKSELQTSLPTEASALSEGQRAFLHRLAAALDQAEWQADPLQTLLFDIARTTPVKQSDAFQAIYCAFLNRNSGPKAGNLLAFLDRNFVRQRCQEVPHDEATFWRASATSIEAFQAWLHKQKLTPTSLTARPHWLAEEALACAEITIDDAKGKPHLHRFLLEAESANQAQQAANDLAVTLLHRD